jgi:glycosyltransferase involved in cell wall biosynthesis
MKILISDVTDSYIFPGGKQVLVHKLLQNLIDIGIDVEFENWHDPNLKPDVVHFLGFNNLYKLKKLKAQGCKLILTHIMDHWTSRSDRDKNIQLVKNWFFKKLPVQFFPMFPWTALDIFDHIVYLHEEDRKSAIKLYGINPEKSSVIPHAVDSLVQFESNSPSDNYLICVASIYERKNSLLTARICNELQIPIIFIGPSWEKNSDYFKEFSKEMTGGSSQYLGFVSEEEKQVLLKNAKGFVLLSEAESGCIAIYEAATYGLPILISDLPWAKSYSNPINLFWTNVRNKDELKVNMKSFYENAQKSLQASFKIMVWKEIAEKYADVYKKCLSQETPA